MGMVAGRTVERARTRPKLVVADSDSAGQDEALVTRESFRRVMSEIPTAVSVVTALENGRVHATTVSAFCSLSIRPALVMLALDRHSDLLAMLSIGTPFGINVLSSSQSHISDACAKKGRNKLDHAEWMLDDGTPRVVGSTAFVRCAVEGMFEGGDHVILTGRVLSLQFGAVEPLVYHRRTYHRPHPLAARAIREG
jgi:flavin reductase (DIM6/NTAB) family NADH-FMN oxidoreductase RutF